MRLLHGRKNRLAGRADQRHLPVFGIGLQCVRWLCNNEYNNRPRIHDDVGANYDHPKILDDDTNNDLYDVGFGESNNDSFKRTQSWLLRISVAYGPPDCDQRRTQLVQKIHGLPGGSCKFEIGMQGRTRFR